MLFAVVLVHCSKGVTLMQILEGVPPECTCTCTATPSSSQTPDVGLPSRFKLVPWVGLKEEVMHYFDTACFNGHKLRDLLAARRVQLAPCECGRVGPTCWGHFNCTWQCQAGTGAGLERRRQAFSVNGRGHGKGALSDWACKDWHCH